VPVGGESIASEGEATVQGRLPTTVRTLKATTGMPAMPAGRLMKVRTTGRTRAMSTAGVPRRAKNRSARASS